MLDKKNQDGPQEDLDDILKDFDEQDELHQRIQEFKKKKEASSAQQEELKERGQIQEEPEEAKMAIEQLKAMQEEKKETEELEQTKVSVIPRQEKAPEEEPAEDEANATVIISEDEMKRLVEEEERQKQDKKAEKKKKKKKSSVGAEVSEEEASRFNKIITIVIAAVVVIGIIIGIIFAVVSTGGDDGTDKSRLENLITQLEELDQNDYTEDEWTALQNALEEAKDGSIHAFFIMDIDKFKEVNDVYGHAVGDVVLRTFGVLLGRQFRGDDIVGRIGGDEFIILMRNVTTKEAVRTKAEQLMAETKKLVFDEMDGKGITISVGIALAPEHGKTYMNLYRSADQALYETKRNGRNGFTIYGENRDITENR